MMLGCECEYSASLGNDGKWWENSWMVTLAKLKAHENGLHSNHFIIELIISIIIIANGV